MTKPLSPETLVYGFTPASDPQVSPDGRRVVYNLAAVSPETKKGSSHIWLCDIDGANKRRLTFSGERNRGARWSPDGTHIAFVSDRVPTNGIFQIAVDGGEAREVMRQNQSIGDLAWSPDGARIVFTSSFDPENPEGEKPKDGVAPAVRVTSRLDYKQDNRGYLGEARNQVNIVDVATGEPGFLTSEPVDHAFPQWSPDGTLVAASRLTTNGMRSQLELIPVDGSTSTLIGPEEGNVGTWAFSPDGARIVFTGDTKATSQSDFFVYTLASEETRRVTADLQCLPAAGFPTLEPPSMPVWLDDSHVLFHAVRAGASGIYVIDLGSGAVEQIEGGTSLRSGFSTDAAHRYIAQGVASLDAVGELLVFDRETGKSSQITEYSAPVFAETPAAKWERFDISRGGYVIESWLLFPPGFDASKKYPLVLDIHGGPNGFYGYGFVAMQQVLATNGFIVLFCNPRGSSSYGREFTQQVTGDWGGEDYLDIMASVDEAVKRPYVDAERLGIYGYSYGGYMTAWTIGQNYRFKAAVCGAPCFDLESMFGTSDISHEFGMLQWGGPPHEAREWYATHSPSQFAHNTKTPTLIIQGEADNRCPVGQSEQMFVTLKQAGCEVEMARYPGGSHLFMRAGPPEHRQDVLARVLAWFQGHL